MADVGEVRARFVADTKSFEKKIKRLVGAIGGLYAVKKIGDAFAAQVKNFAAFEKGLAEVSTLSNFTAKQMRLMADETLKFSVRFNQTTKALNKARYDIVSAGFAKMSQQTKLLAVASKMAVAGVSDVSTTTDLLTTVLNSYRIPATKAMKVSDTLFSVVKEGKTTITEMAASWGTMLPSAKAAGMSLEDLGGAFAVLTAAGIDSQNASTYLRGAIDKLINPTKEAAEYMETFGFSARDSSGNLRSIVDIAEELKVLGPDAIRAMIPDVRAQMAMLSLANNADMLRQKVESIKGGAGRTEEAFTKMAGTLDFQLGQLGKRWDAFWIKLFQGKAGEALAGGFASINEYIDKNSKLIEQVVEVLGNWLAKAIKDGFLPLLDGFMKAILGINMAFQEWSKSSNATAAALKDIVAWMKELTNIGWEKFKKWSLPSPGALGAQAFQSMVTGHQAGGFVPGSGSGDIVPAMLEPGELIIPKSDAPEMAAIWKNVRGYQAGGVVGASTQHGYRPPSLPGAGEELSFLGKMLGAGYLAPEEMAAGTIAIGDGEYISAVDNMIAKGTEFIDFQSQMAASINQEFGAVIGGTYDQLAMAFGNLVKGHKVGSKAIAQALRTLVAQSILAVGKEAAVKAIFSLAEGIFAAARGDPRAGAFFAAAAKYAAVATVAAAAGGAMAAGGGGGGEAGGGYGGGYGGPAEGEEAGAATGGMVVNITVHGNVVDTQAFVEEHVVPVLSEAVGRGVAASSEYNITGERD